MEIDAQNRHDVAVDAQLLRRFHVPGEPIVLANVWDPPSAQVAVERGQRVVATTSAGVALCNGFKDHGVMPPQVALSALEKIASAVVVPVTADFEDGYGLTAVGIVDRLLAVGVSGLNIEDSNHRDGGLVEMERHGERLHAIKEAAWARGVDLVLNARVDVRPHRLPLEEGLRRASHYRDAGADCIYPIGEQNLAALEQYVAIGPVNAMYSRGSPSIPELRSAKVSRISVGPGLFRLSLERIGSAIQWLTDEDELAWECI